MMPTSSYYCGRSPSKTFLKNDDLLLHNQIVLYFNAFSAYNLTAFPRHPRYFSRVVCPGVSVRPPGRYVQNRVENGSVYFWLLHVQASIECPSHRPPNYEDFHLRLNQWIARSEAESSRNDIEEAYERGHKESGSLSLSCTSSQRSITLRDRVRDLKVLWDIFPSRFPMQSENDTKEATDRFLAGFKDIPPELKIRIQITSRLHFGGNLSLSRKQQLCELYGYWCNGDFNDDEVDALRRQQRDVDREAGTCIRPTMRCDGLPDCWLDDPENSPDEVGCYVGHPTDIEEPLSPLEPFNETYPSASSSSTGRGQSWTSKLPWMVVAFVPAVLLCALVRICSQRRQLDFATVDGDLRALEAHDGAAFGHTGLLRRPHSLPAFDNAIAKKSLTRGRNFLAFALRRSRSTEDVLSYPSAVLYTIPLKPLKIVETVENPLATRNYSHLFLAEEAIREGKKAEKRESCNFQVAPEVRKNRSGAVNRMISSCWSGDFSISSTSSSLSNSPMNQRVVSVEEGDDDCDVCRQMRESVLMMKTNEETGENKIRYNGSRSLGSAASTPSTTSTSGVGQPDIPLEKPLKSPTASIISNTTTPMVEFHQNGIEMTARNTLGKASDDPLLEPLMGRSGQYDNPIHQTTSDHEQVT